MGIALHALHVAAGLGGSGSDSFFDVYVYNAVLVASAAVCLLRGVTVASERWAWIAFGLGLSLWAAGDVYWTASVAADPTPAYPSPADLLFLAGYPALYAGIALLVRARVGRFGSSMWLDGAIGALAAAAMGTALLHPALLELSHGNGPEVAVNLAYALGDLVLLSLVVGAVAIVGATGWRDWGLIAAGLLVSGVADAAYVYQDAIGTYTEGTGIDTAWMVAAGLIAMAAWTGAGRVAAAEPSTDRSLFFPSLFAIVAVTLQVHDLTRPLSPLAAGLATATLAIVVLRLFVAFAEHNRLLGTVRRESVTDALTGLGNRRSLLADLQQALESRGGRRARAFAIGDPGRGASQARSAQRPGVGAAADPHVDRRAYPRDGARDGPGRAAGALDARALGRPGVSGRALARAGSTRGADHLRLRCVRRDDVGALLQAQDGSRGRSRGTAPMCRHAVRPDGGRARV